ncbi:uncharacterized protein DDB_G0290685-like isoform X3 [Eucalyptus grandis]|uniref:uncharacterized protein DDB_G0290685-like isoform X3 n=1 Tax=Eucalyptus grandis TaxID=71139 RepID=UPI00192E969B|nr:uncharacterized protein DDB_G0290685-like isoform X3 [Eucalyptus grandis]
MASSRYQVEVTLIGAKDLENVDSRHGPLRPYAVVWADPNQKRPTRVDPEGDSFPVWDQTLPIPLPPGAAVDDVMLHVHIVHASSEDGIRPLIGSAQLRLRDVLDDDNGYGGAKRWSLQLKRPSGRPHGKVDIKVAVRETRYRAPPTAYGVRPPQASREYAATPAYGSAYTAPPAYRSADSKPYASPQQPQYERRDPYYPKAPPAGYPSYGGTSYDQAPSSYGQEGKKKKSKFGGMGTGLAVGGLAGVLGGLALAEVAEYVENKITNHAAEKAEDDLAYQDDGDGDYYQDDGDDYQEDGGDGNDYQYDGNNDGQDYQDSGGGGDGNYYQYGGDYGQDYGDGNDYQNHGDNGDDGQVYVDGNDYQDDSGDGNDYQNHGGNGDDAQVYGDGDDYQDDGGDGNDYQNHGGNGDDAQVYGDGEDYQDGSHGNDYQNHGGDGDDGQVYGDGDDYQEGGHGNDYQNHGGNGEDGQVYGIGDDYQDNDGDGNDYQYDGNDGQDYGDGDGDGEDSQDDRDDYY